MGYIESIDTFYNGNYYRSRLEARWAVYFDLIHEPYEYEPEGLMFNGKFPYLPDFYLPRLKLICEIKNKNAFYVSDYCELVSGTQKAERYKCIARDIKREGGLYVIFMGAPYDYLYGHTRWWWDQHSYPYMEFSDAEGNHTMSYSEVIDNAIRDVINPNLSEQAKYAQKVRFEHGETPEEMISKFEQHKKRMEELSKEETPLVRAIREHNERLERGSGCG